MSESLLRPGARVGVMLVVFDSIFGIELRPGACGCDGHSLNEYPLGAWPFSEKWEEVMGARGGHVVVKNVRNFNNGGAGVGFQKWNRT